jgi:hypothetical protein
VVKGFYPPYWRKNTLKALEINDNTNNQNFVIGWHGRGFCGMGFRHRGYYGNRWGY